MAVIVMMVMIVVMSVIEMTHDNEKSVTALNSKQYPCMLS